MTTIRRLTNETTSATFCEIHWQIARWQSEEGKNTAVFFKSLTDVYSLKWSMDFNKLAQRVHCDFIRDIFRLNHLFLTLSKIINILCNVIYFTISFKGDSKRKYNFRRKISTKKMRVEIRFRSHFLRLFFSKIAFVLGHTILKNFMIF